MKTFFILIVFCMGSFENQQEYGMIIYFCNLHKKCCLRDNIFVFGNMNL